jgi:hypothetical protein
MKWLSTQIWIKIYKELNNYITKNIHTTKHRNNDSPTPNHNKIQNLFLFNNNRYHLFTYFYNFDEKIINHIDIEFEDSLNFDMVLSYKEKKCFCFNTEYILFCEIKTNVGEEYPCVLRKMKQQISYIQNRKNIQKKFCLLIDNLDLSTTSENDFISIFKLSNIDVIFLRDIRKK